MEFLSGDETRSYLEEQKRKLQKLINVVQDYKNSGESEMDDDIENYLTRFLVIRACGYIEEVYRRSVCWYVEYRSRPGIRDLVFNAKFSRGANPTRDHIKRTLKDLDPVLENDFLALLGDNDSLKSLVETRNKVAHGQSDTCLEGKRLKKGTWL